MPEPPLVRELFNLAHERSHGEPFGPRIVVLMAHLMWWDVPNDSTYRLDEPTAARWLARGGVAEWKGVARIVGEALHRRGWRQTAAQLYPLWRQPLEAYRGLVACRALFEGWRRAGLELSHADVPVNRTRWLNEVGRAVIEVGAACYDEADGIKGFWARIGGPARLSSMRDADALWVKMFQLARLGAIEGGLTGLVEALANDLPENKELPQIAAELRRHG